MIEHVVTANSELSLLPVAVNVFLFKLEKKSLLWLNERIMTNHLYH